MHKIDVPSATEDNQFTDGSPSGGVPATTVPATWLNDLQNNLCFAIEQAGFVLSKGDETQLYNAILAVAMGLLPERSFTASDYIRIPDTPGGLIIQWGGTDFSSSIADVVQALPIAFPNVFLRVLLTQGYTAGSGGISYAGGHPLTNGSFNWRASASNYGYNYIAIGY